MAIRCAGALSRSMNSTSGRTTSERLIDTSHLNSFAGTNPKFTLPPAARILDETPFVDDDHRRGSQALGANLQSSFARGPHGRALQASLALWGELGGKSQNQ